MAKCQWMCRHPNYLNLLWFVLNYVPLLYEMMFMWSVFIIPLWIMCQFIISVLVIHQFHSSITSLQHTSLHTQRQHIQHKQWTCSSSTSVSPACAPIPSSACHHLDSPLKLLLPPPLSSSMAEQWRCRDPSTAGSAVFRIDSTHTTWGTKKRAQITTLTVLI